MEGYMIQPSVAKAVVLVKEEEEARRRHMPAPPVQMHCHFSTCYYYHCLDLCLGICLRHRRREEKDPKLVK
jgi:hypothetical protein